MRLTFIIPLLLVCAVVSAQQAENESTENTSFLQKLKCKTYHSSGWNVELGLSNWVNPDFQIPSVAGAVYTLDPLNSRYLALTKHYTKTWWFVGFDAGVGVSVRMYDFDDRDLVLTMDNNDLLFDTSTPQSGKVYLNQLAIPHLNAYFVPMIGDKLQFGIGGFAGYRIGGSFQQLTRGDGGWDWDRNRDNFNLNPFQYGVRAQVAYGRGRYRKHQIFFQYDLSETFNSSQGPELRGFALGVIL